MAATASVRFVQHHSSRSVVQSRRQVMSIALNSRSGAAEVTAVPSPRSADVRRIRKERSSDGSALGVAALLSEAYTRVAFVLRSLFLPEGYPSSVTPDYFAFQAWDTAQAMCSYLRGILATQAILDGVGVGDGTKTVASATLQWVTRDGASMFGGLVFTWWGGTNFDRSVKFWRLFADAINDVGLTLEMISPLCGEYFLLVACIGNVCKTMCGISAGATRTSITAHFAKKGNLADVAAKEGSQETAVNMLGLISGVAFAYFANSSATMIWITFVTLTVVHVIANYFAVTSLQLSRINIARLHVIVGDVLTHCEADRARSLSDGGPDWYSNAMFGCKAVNARESLWYPWGSFFQRGARVKYKVGAAVSAIPSEAAGWSDLVRQLEGGCNTPFVVLASRQGATVIVYIVYTREVSSVEQLGAFITAEVLRWKVTKFAARTGVVEEDKLRALIQEVNTALQKPASDHAQQLGGIMDHVGHVRKVLGVHNWDTHYFSFPHSFCRTHAASAGGVLDPEEQSDDKRN